MARKLTIDLSVEQMQVLRDTAERRSTETTGNEQVRWQAIARESARALAYAALKASSARDDR